MKNKYTSKLMICVTMLVALCSCDFARWILGVEPDLLYINNDADFNIGYYAAVGGLYGSYYPDSLPLTDSLVVKKMEPKTRKILLHKQSTWKRYFENLPYNKLSVFIFNSDTLDAYSWDKVRDEYKILKRYDLSLDDIRNLDYNITFSQ